MIREALEHFERALRDDPKLFWAQLFLDVGRLKLGQPGEAKGHLTVCIEQEPKFVWSYLIRGHLHAERLEFKSAEADFAEARKLIQANPDQSAEYVLFVNQGVMRARQGDFEAAVEDDTSRLMRKDDTAIAAPRPTRYPD